MSSEEPKLLSHISNRGVVQLLMNRHSQLPRVYELDGLRGILAAWVAVSHIFCWSGFAVVIWPRPFGRIWPQFVFAQPAVEVFIILSGFAISYLLHAKEQRYGEFLKGRFFRIYPIYLTCLGFAIATTSLTTFITQQAQWRDTIYFQWINELANSATQQFRAHAIAHLTLLNGLIPHKILPSASGTLLTPAWSISLEWQYYLVAPFIARYFTRSGLYLVLLSCVAYWGMRMQGLWLNPHLAFLPAQLPLFMIGIGSYHFYVLFSGTRGWRTSRFSVLIGAIVSGAILLSWHPVALAVWGITLGCICVDGDGVFERALRWLRAVLLHPWLQKLGRISYPLYLVHWPIIIVCMALLLRCNPMIHSGEAVVLMLLLATPVMLVVATALHYWVEAPLMKMGKRGDNNKQR